MVETTSLPADPDAGGPSRRPGLAPGTQAGFRTVLPVALLIFMAIALPLIWLHVRNPRLFASWHGFLHSAIAGAFPFAEVPPENPFFAGEALPYYWGYHALGGVVSLVLGVDLLQAFRLITFASLAAMVATCVWAGARLLGSSAAGVAALALALAGANPLGPAIAALNHFRGLGPLFQDISPPVETLAVSSATADAYMSHPLLGALYIGGDWRVGQNLAWLLDISGRTPALALLLVLATFVLAGGTSRGLDRVRLSATAAAAAGLTVLNPLIGLAVAGALAGAAFGLVLLDHGSKRTLWPAAATVVGAVAVFPTYWHLFAVGGSGAVLGSGASIARGAA